MTRRPLTRDAVAAHLGYYWADASWPAPSNLAALTAVAWNEGWNEAPVSPADDRQLVGVDFVVKAVFPLGFASGKRAGVLAVDGHITAAAHEATGRLSDENDPGRVVRGLLDQLTAAAHDEVRRHDGASTEAGSNRPLGRTFEAAASDNRARTNAQRAAAAASVAWTHAVKDGWRQAYWTANRIIIPIRDSKLAATNAIDGIPAVDWLDDLAEAARAIADERPGQHPAQLARLAGPAETPSTASGDHAAREAPSAAKNHHNNGLDKGDRRHRGM
ncbi:hypothetical protein [Salinispora pacifica]|uniref:hypothetical protein n=1 Tax=Salinispora pacifica TaxID=351187 RepID=UPI00036D3887|nr:hypothetical protein [Salinispora pacifica]